MTLVDRVSGFFLGWLGLSLLGFAATLYFLVRADLYEEVDNQLRSTLATMSAIAEIESEGIEWEPREHVLQGLNLEEQHGEWYVLDQDQHIIDRSTRKRFNVADLPPTTEPTTEESGSLEGPDQAVWRWRRRTVQQTMTVEATGEGHHNNRYPALTLVVAMPLKPVFHSLRRLLFLLAGLTVGLWVFAAIVGRWLGRRTLAPVVEFALAARSLDANQREERLPIRNTGDELQELGNSFNDLLDRLQETFEQQRRFTGDASHQLRTPLTAMLGQVEVALRRDRDPAEYRRVLQLVEAEARGLHRVIEALLFLARADVEALLPEMERLDIVQWIGESVEAWRNRYPKSDRLILDLPKIGTSYIVAHRALLEQLIGNLLDNAFQYGEGEVALRVEQETHGGRLLLTVRDAGPGIPPEELSKLFEPFYRGVKARQSRVRGVGLGLSVARRIALALGAELTANSTLGRGSRFTLAFPPVLTEGI